MTLQLPKTYMVLLEKKLSPYRRWFTTAQAAISAYPGIELHLVVAAAHAEPGWMRVWLCFDLDNGDDVKGRYVWAFGTWEEARKHYKTQKAEELPTTARLSPPQLWYYYQGVNDE